MSELRKTLVSLLIGVLLLGLAGVVSADEPLGSTVTSPTPTATPLVGKGSSAPAFIQAGRLVLDPATGGVAHVELAQAPIAPMSASPGKLDALPLARPGGRALKMIPGRANTADDLLIGSPATSDRGGKRIRAASSTTILSEGFESGFPGAGWTLIGNHQWDDVACFPVMGTYSAWPAADAVDPCGANTYPNNVQSRMEYGPFSLADAKSASLDFYFRLQSESCDPYLCDYLFWGASTDGTNYTGYFAAGTFTGGPFSNGYNFTSLDLSYLAGAPQVWIAFDFVSDGSVVDRGPFIDMISVRKNSNPRTYLTNENFDVIEFPNSTWESFDADGTVNGEYYWDDVGLTQGSFCPPLSGDWSMWPADEGANGLNPCAGDNYANDMNAWLIHGPFSLAEADEAWVDFYFRNWSELGNDYLFWGASADGSKFYGPATNSGDYTSGPYYNGYNLMRLNLGNVPGLGSLLDDPDVWLAFVFHSNSSATYQGPFIDNVSVVVERPVKPVFLPIVLKSPVPAIPKTNLFINNQTGGLITNYRVYNPRFNKAPIPDIVCANIPAGATRYSCNATFDTGTYRVSSTNTCDPPTTSGQVTFREGDDVRLIRCLR